VTAIDARARRRILVADDLRDTADSLARLLAELGHHVIVAYDGEDALRQAEAHRPEIVLLDLGMPKIDGCEVARRIRAQTWSAGMRLIAQTGWGQESDRQRTREAGFDAHFVKPLDMAALLAAVESKP
jgi:DNA-binding response OmpR family regulator